MAIRADEAHMVFRSDQWLRTYELDRNTALEYFSFSDFYDPSRDKGLNNNEALRAKVRSRWLFFSFGFGCREPSSIDTNECRARTRGTNTS